MKRWRGKAEWLLFTAIVVIAVIGFLLLQNVNIDVLQPKGVVASQQRNLLFIALAMSALVVIPVFIMLGIFAYKYRADRQAKDYQPEWKENSKLEAVWWGIPMTIIATLAVITWYTSHSLDPYKPIAAKHSAVNVQVIALQWKWLFLYPDDHIATVNYLKVPKGVPVHFSLTADAPMSAFWIPALGSQIYNMNGMSSQLNLLATSEGVYKGYTTNINGKGYADMTFDVDTVSHAHYHEWLALTNTRNLPQMNMAAFTALRKPSVEKSVKTFTLSDDNLYNQVLEKYMQPSSMQDMKQYTGVNNEMDGHH